MVQETWMPIPNFPDYEISDRGRVKSLKRSLFRILRPSTGKSGGYLGVNLMREGKPYYMKVHVLVMLAFVGPCPGGLEICHRDGNPQNNCLSNLRYDTHVNNMAEAIFFKK